MTVMRPATKTPRLTAGLMWHPETGPMPYAAQTSPRPKANAMPTIPTLSPATTAVPTPKTTRIKVPTSSAKYFVMLPPFSNSGVRARLGPDGGSIAREEVDWLDGLLSEKPLTWGELSRLQAGDAPGVLQSAAGRVKRKRL